MLCLFVVDLLFLDWIFMCVLLLYWFDFLGLVFVDESIYLVDLCMLIVCVIDLGVNCGDGVFEMVVV